MGDAAAEKRKVRRAKQGLTEDQVGTHTHATRSPTRLGRPPRR